MSKSFKIYGIRTPSDFDGFPCPDDPPPDNYREMSWVWVTDKKKFIARVQGQKQARILTKLLNDNAELFVGLSELPPT